MAISIQTLENGDMNYIAKHNANYTNIKFALEALARQSTSTTLQANLTAPLGFEAAFGNTLTVIGAHSYEHILGSGPGSLVTFTVAAGYAWIQSLRAVVSQVTSTDIDFSGLTPGTYYIHLDSAGVPYRDTIPTEALYSVEMSGDYGGFPIIGTVTLLASVAWAAPDWIAARNSTQLGVTYLTLDERLEAGEALAKQGSDAMTALGGKLTKSVAGGSNITLTTSEAKAAYMEFTGALTGNIQVIFPVSSAYPRILNVKNSTTGAYTLECIGTSGTGKKVAQGYSTFLHREASLIERANTDAYTVAAIVPYASTITLDWSMYDTAHITLTGNATITHTNARPGQKVLLYLAQDGTGGHTVTWTSEVQYGNDVSGIALSSAASKTDEVGFSYNWVASKYNVVSVARGY
jgi:hypothetical protein